ncbi:MAG: GNAT family N-acetyltransferase [Bacteroidota bacterium]
MSMPSDTTAITTEYKSFEQLSTQELYDIMALRQVVFVIEQSCIYLDADGKDQKAHHLTMRMADGQLVGYTRLLPEGIPYEGHASIGRVITSKMVRGKGLGRELMRQSIEAARSLYPGMPLKISAQVYLIKFYESFGFQTVGDVYDEDGLPHIAMRLT